MAPVFLVPFLAAGLTVWDGVYTEAQAARGKARYEAICSSCHRDGPRKDEPFMRDWSGSDVERLFTLIKTTMPTGAPASLNDNTYLDIVAYTLQVNTFPAGLTELTAAAIKNVRIEGRNGPEPVPNYALVMVVGCLIQGRDGAWMLASGTQPVRTRDPAASKDEALKYTAAPGPGTERLQLMNVYPPPDPYRGHN